MAQGRQGGCILNRDEDANDDRQSPELTVWIPAEYRAGYSARFADCPESRAATHCWRTGWQDADTELSAAVRQKLTVTEGGTEEFEETWWALYDIGGDTRVHGIPFDEDRTEPWKLGWIDADIKLGTIGK